MTTIAVTGATGLMGRRVIQALVDRGDRVLALVRSPGESRMPAGVEARRWNASMPEAPLQGADAVVHLAGSPIASGRWTKRRKRSIRDSRVLGTRSVVAGMGEARVLVSASGIDVNGDTGEALVDENTPPGTGFLPEVARDWEAEALKARGRGARVALIRSTLVLAREGGALPRMALPFRFGAGGSLGGGRQWVSWLSIEDQVRLILHVLDGNLEGPVIAAAPEPVRQRDLARAIGHALHRPSLVPVPAAALRLLLGEMAQVILSSHRALPRKALGSGFSWHHPDLASALAAELG